MNAIEIELERRSMLSEEKYLEILSDIFFKKEKIETINMINRYFDSDDLMLQDNHILIRSRETYHSVVLTLKISKKNQGSKEISQKLTYHQHQDLIEHGKFPRGIVKIKLRELGYSLFDIHYQGQNKVRRIQYKMGNSLICIDKTIINGNTDYNIEVESTSLEKADQILKELSEKYNFEITKDYISKSRRTLKNGN